MRYTIRLLVIALLTLPSAWPRELGEPDLDSDEFVKRFTATYGVLSEKEPPLTDIEIAILKKMAPMMRVNREYAQSLLQSLTVAETKSSPTFNYLLGNIYFENEEYFLAEEQYKTAIENFPDFQRAWTNLGVLKLRSNDTRSALIAFIRAVELGDSKSETFGMLGYCHYRQGNYVSAEVAYNRAMLSEPDNLDWLEGKAQVYLEAERYVEAIRAQDELIARRPNDLQYWLAQTNAYLAFGDTRRAARNLEITRSLGHEDFQSLFLLGSLYTKLEMHGPSADAYVAASKLAEPSNIDFLAKAAKQLLHVRENDAARELFARIDAQSEDLSGETLLDYYLLKSQLAVLEDDLATAIAALESAEVRDPTNGEILVKLAQLNSEAGNLNKAYYLLDRAELDPESEYDALLTRIKLLIDEQRFAESQTYVTRALNIRSTESVQNLYQQVRQAALDQSGS